MRRVLRWFTATVFLGALVACSGEFGHRLGKLFPFLRKDHPELNYPPVNCEAEIEEPPPREQCVTQTLSCPDSIVGTTFGAEKFLGDEFYLSNELTTGGYDYDDSGEVVYELTLPENVEAEITLISPCADLDLFAFRDNRDAKAKKNKENHGCPSNSSSLKETEYSQRESAVDGVKVTTTQLRQKYRTFLVIVDGKGSEGNPGGQHGNYRLEVKCTQ